MSVHLARAQILLDLKRAAKAEQVAVPSLSEALPSGGAESKATPGCSSCPRRSRSAAPPPVPAPARPGTGQQTGPAEFDVPRSPQLSPLPVARPLVASPLTDWTPVAPGLRAWWVPE